MISIGATSNGALLPKCHLLHLTQDAQFTTSQWIQQDHSMAPHSPVCMQEAASPHLKGQLKRYLISLLRISSHFCSSRLWRRAVFLV